jgi:hypothetical protein
MVNNYVNTVFANPVKTIFKLLIVSTILIVLAGTINPVSAATWYVTTNGDDSINGGTGWEDAFLTIQQGVSTASDGDIVLVADGTYSGVGNYDINFGLYASKNIVIRSLNGPENCVIDCLGLGRGFRLEWIQTNDTVIDGFTIANGNTNDSLSYGGAIKCDMAYPIIRNCIFKNNIGGQWGGALDFRNSSASNQPKIINCMFVGNSASLGGGAVSTYSAAPIFINCTFYNNSAGSFGGAIALGTPDGGTSFVNSIFWSNSPQTFGGTPTVTYSLMPFDYEGEGNINDDPDFVNPTSDDLRLQPGSPCIDAGDDENPNLPLTDIDNKPRRIDGDDNLVVIVDMGAHEHGDVCECDYLEDLDTDGLDLVEYINNPNDQELSVFAEDFGRINCAKY